jgi:hypothetical protein
LRCGGRLKHAPVGAFGVIPDHRPAALLAAERFPALAPRAMSLRVEWLDPFRTTAATGGPGRLMSHVDQSKDLTYGA